MIEYAVDEASVTRTVEWLEAVRLKIFEGIREAMDDSMLELARVTVEEMGAAGIKNRTGELAEGIINSPQVHETPQVISGRVTAKANMSIQGRTFMGFLGTALDEGYTIPPQSDVVWAAVNGDGAEEYRHGHSTIKVEPHPFLRQAQQVWMPSFVELVEERVNEVIAEANR